MEFTSRIVSDGSIQIEWDNQYPECFNFSVSARANDVSVEETTYDTNYTLSLSLSTTYRVCVVARDGHGSTHTNWIYCADITTVTCELCIAQEVAAYT